MKLAVLAIPVAIFAVPVPAFAQAPDYFVANCYNCHGTDGHTTGAVPPLAGLSKTYILEQIGAFKSGVRPATVMHQLIKGYTEDEIIRAAEHFAKQKK